MVLGVLLVAVPLAMRSFDFEWSKLVVAHAVLAVACGVWAWRVGGGWQGWPTGPTVVPMALLAIYGCLSILWADNRFHAIRLLLVVACAGLTYAFVTGTVQWDEGRFLRLFAAVSAGAAAVAALGLVQASGLPGHVAALGPVGRVLAGLPFLVVHQDAYGRPTPGATFGLTNFAAEYVVTTVPLSLAVVIRARRRRVLAALPFVLSLLYLGVARHRASYLAALASLALVAILLAATVREREARRRLVRHGLPAAGVGVALLVAVLAGTTPGRDVAARFASIFRRADPTVQTRLEIWQAAGRMVAAHPLLGVGAGNFAPAVLAHQSEALERATLATNTTVGRAHNELLSVTAEGGLVGLGLLVWVLGGVVASARRALACGVTDPRCAVALVAALVALGVTACFGFPLQRTTTVVAMGALVGLLEVVRSAPGRPAAAGAGWGIDPLGRLAPRTRRQVLVALGVGGCAVAIGGVWMAAQRMEGERMYRAGIAAQQAGLLHDALAAYDAAHAHDGGSEWILYNRAFVKLSLGDRAGAVADLGTCLARTPHYSKGRAELGMLLLDAGRPGDALEQLERARATTRAGTSTVDALSALARLDRGEVARARALAMGVVQTGGDQASALAVAGMVLLRLGAREVAAPAIRAAADAEPWNPRVRLARGLLELDEDLATATEDLEAARQALPASAEAHLGLARAALRDGRRAEALGYLATACALVPAMATRAAGDAELGPLAAEIARPQG